MATAVLIDLSNYDTHLVESTQSRSGTPNGNVYFDLANGLIEFITKQELAQVDLGSGNEDNPLDETLGIKLEAAYGFEVLRRRLNETLRGHDDFIDGNFKYAGAYNFINSRKPSTTADRKICRGSGWSEYASDGGVDRIYFGAKGLGDIEAASQLYYQHTDGGAPTNFTRLGNMDEAVQVFGDTGNTPSDSSAGDFDSTTYFAANARTFGNTYDRKESTTDLGIAELGGYSTGFALVEAEHLTTGDYSLADVYGGSQIAPWTSMGLEELGTPVVVSGFNEADGTFTWVLNNAANGSLDECVAFLDALEQTDNDINDHATNVTHGKRAGLWYYYDATGKVITQSGADTKGLYIYNIPTADEQSVAFTDDAAGLKTTPFTVALEIDIGATAKADSLAWYHFFFAQYYNNVSPAAVTVEDASGTDIKGSASSANSANKIISSFDYDGDTVGGTAGTNKDCVFLCEGDGGATQAKTLVTLTRSTTISFVCSPTIENNM